MAPDNHLSTAMGAAVPLWIMQMQEHGGPSEEDLKYAQETSSILGSEGDKLLFRGKKKGETARIFNRTAKAIAVLSFCPGGITIFGQHFEAKKGAE